MQGGGLTLKQLRCLVALEDTAHFRHAAERCGITQPSLSAQIKNLEGVLGVQLVERNRAGVTMTPVGRSVVATARRILDDVQAIADFTAGAQHGLLGTIRLGTKPTLGPYLMPHVVARLHRKYPDLNLYVREGAPKDLEHELASGLHDVILAQVPVAGADLVTERLFREPLYLAMARDDPLARRAQVTVEDLRGLRMLSLNPDYHLHDQIAELCRAYGSVLVRDYEGTSLDALRQMVGMGMGVTFLPALYVHSEIHARSEIAVRPLKGSSFSRSVGLVWRKSAGRASAYRQMADLVREVAGSRFKDLAVEN